jgi:HSP20 family protein
MQLTRRFTNQAGDLFTEFDNLFRHAVGRPSSKHALPREFSLYETPTSWVLRVDLPGFKKEDLNLEVTDGVLTLDAVNEHEHFGAEVHQRLRLPKDVRTNDITARLELGILQLELPKVEPETPEARRIEIN